MTTSSSRNIADAFESLNDPETDSDSAQLGIKKVLPPVFVCDTYFQYFR